MPTSRRAAWDDRRSFSAAVDSTSADHADCRQRLCVRGKTLSAEALEATRDKKALTFLRFANCKLGGARGRNRTGTPRGGGFSYHFGFRRPVAGFVVWSTPSPSSFDIRCPPSALYTFPCVQGLGSALARTNGPGPSPSLTGFTSRISSRGLKLCWSESPASTSFTTRAEPHYILPRPQKARCLRRATNIGGGRFQRAMVRAAVAALTWAGC